MKFVDLNRYFVPLKEDQEPSLDIGHRWGPRLIGWLSWEDLSLRRRVILLAEAYSGKTEEFRHQCEVERFPPTSPDRGISYVVRPRTWFGCTSST
jgi:hypothetical protein